MKPLNTYLYLAAIYVLVTAAGLHVGSTLTAQIREGAILPAVPEGDNPKTSVSIFAYVLVFTAVLLVLFKLGLDFIIQLFTYVALYVGVLITFTAFIGDAGLLASAAYYLTALYLRKTAHIMNLTLALTVAGIGGFLGASLAVFPALLLLLILSAYDLIAVFGTKHMITLAEKSKDRIPFMFLVPAEDRHLGLGTGDLTLPLVFTVSVLRDYALTNAIATAAGGLIGLTALYAYILKKGHVTLPALPPIAIGLFAGYTTSLVIF